MKFYAFHQNNSGGRFTFDKKAGITHIVIIEAPNAEAANDRAEQIGLYFNGCDEGRDCNCCGDRWFQVYGEGDDVPSHYGSPIEDGKFAPSKFGLKWMGKNPEGIIHYACGKRVWVEAQ